jgi:hypothetical protein
MTCFGSGVCAQGQVVGKPFAFGGQSSKRFAFVLSLRALENQHCVEFDAWLPDAADTGNKKYAPGGAIEICVLGPGICRKPIVNSRHAVPFKPREKIADGMVSMHVRDIGQDGFVKGERCQKAIGLLNEKPEADCACIGELGTERGKV